MKVELSDYNPEWAELFLSEKRLIADKLGNEIVTVEHVGSTAVRGLGAKPIIDMLLGVRKISDADAFIPKMLELGYEYRNSFENVMPYRRYFTKPGFYHVHTVEVTSDFWRRHLLFRDYMRAHDDIRDAYYRMKKELAERQWDDVNDYAYAKTEFIRKTEGDALKEFTLTTEKAECDAIYDLFSSGSDESKELCGAKTERLGTAALVRTDIFPGFTNNRVTGLGLDSRLNQSTIDKVKEFYSLSKNKHAIQLSPPVLTEETKKLLLKNGYEYKNNWVRFCRDISPIENVKTDLEVRLIGKEYAGDFARLVTRNFNFPAEMTGLLSSAVPAGNMNYYVSFDNYKPVGAGCAHFGKDTAWIGMAATEESHRGRGSQAAILSARIDEARRRGCKWIAVETAEETAEHDAPSYRNMLRYGFRLLYKRPNYVFEP